MKTNWLVIIVLLLTLIFCSPLAAQEFIQSNLPIVVIATDDDPLTGEPMEIPDEPKILADMKIIWHTDGSTNYLTDTGTSLNYNGRIGIELRGSSSQSLPKKGYGLTTLQADGVSNNNVSILGMPSENDWILNGLADDSSLIRDYISYNLSRQMGNYATRTVYCEVVLNGEYIGLYIMQEKIKADGNRVNVVKITTSDLTMPNLSGGYITKADKTTGGDPVAWVMESNAGSTDFIHELPKPEDVTSAQNTYIQDQFLSLATTSAFNNSSYLFGGYPTIIDIPTFVDFMIINELAGNIDAYQYSTYFHKDRGGKLRAGPIWDFNYAYGGETDVWQFSDGDNEGAKFWTDLFNSPIFKCYLSKRWNQLTQPGQPLNYTSITSFIDQSVVNLIDAIAREHQKWGTVPNHPLEISNVKQWLWSRSAWMTASLGPYSSCENVALPPLVINKINYNPGTFPGFNVSNDLEFIEIKNISTMTASLGGVYFKELGISYGFPPLANLAPNASVFIASNPTVFQAKYGFAPFGQFYRNLSNNSQKLVLADAFGNTIDYVEYDDEGPWPNADGNGNYLQLNDVQLDNNMGTNWTAMNSNLLSMNDLSAVDFVVFPNPVDKILSITSQVEMERIRIYSVDGALLHQSEERGISAEIDVSGYQSGIYFVSVNYSGRAESCTQKVIKL